VTATWPIAFGRQRITAKQFDLSPCVSPVCLERLFPLCRPKRPRLFVLIASELASHPELRTENGGAIISGQL
jgi:hypothetical protein